jgi:hypothetical protein
MQESNGNLCNLSFSIGFAVSTDGNAWLSAVDGVHIVSAHSQVYSHVFHYLVGLLGKHAAKNEAVDCETFIF